MIENRTYIITLIGGIGNIIQTAPIMVALKDSGHKVIARQHGAAYCTEICRMLSPCYDELIAGSQISGAVDKGSLFESQEGKRLMQEIPEWAAWFKWHGLKIPENPEVKMEIEKAPCPSRVVLAPCCKPNWPMKQWPHWNELISKMPGCTVVGLKNDGGDLQGDFIDLRGKSSLVGDAGIIADADYVISLEGGIAHLACAVGTRTYILYGGTNPIKNQTPKNSIQIMSSKKFDCRPCRPGGCFSKAGTVPTFYGCNPRDMKDGYSRCMNAISPHEVMKAIADNGDDCISPIER